MLMSYLTRRSDSSLEAGYKAFKAENGGGERDRTDDLLRAKQALSQLSYTPVTFSIASIVDRAGGPGRT